MWLKAKNRKPEISLKILRENLLWYIIVPTSYLYILWQYSNIVKKNIISIRFQDINGKTLFCRNCFFEIAFFLLHFGKHYSDIFTPRNMENQKSQIRHNEVLPSIFISTLTTICRRQIIIIIMRKFFCQIKRILFVIMLKL